MIVLKVLKMNTVKYLWEERIWFNASYEAAKAGVVFKTKDLKQRISLFL